MEDTDKIIAKGRIAGAYMDLTGGEDGKFVSIRQVRELTGIADLDEILIGMYADQIINLIPQSNQMALTEADRAAAVRCGGQDKHLMAWSA